MELIDLSVLAAVGYFAVFGIGFLVRPELVSRFALRWTDAAGRTEVRCYYGAVSCALAAFLGYLLAQDLATEALTGVLLLASAVLVTRVVATFVDGGQQHPYTRMALPVETAFVVAVAAVLLVA